MSCYSGKRDSVFGTTVCGRASGLANMDTADGLFINTLAMRANISLDSPLADCFGDLQAQQVALQRFEQISLDVVQSWSDVPAGSSLFESVLQFENYPIDESLKKRN